MDIATIRRHPERSVAEEATNFLAQGLIANVGIVQDGQPFVLPMIYHFDPEQGDRLYLHGANASRLMAQLGAGTPTCITVTLIDGLVFSRSALYHSVNYRSVMCFGSAHLMNDLATKNVVLEKMIGRYFPSRTVGVDYRAASENELAATALIEFRIEHLSAKRRTGGPKGPFDDDSNAPGTCGVVEVDGKSRLG
jgi:uncharacterized protein